MSTEPSRARRLRKHPSKRFAPRERKLDVDACLEDLLEEKHDPTDGHRQITIARHDALTVTLFHFEAASSLPEHLVDGAVTIHVLEGVVDIETDHEVHHLENNDMLVLAPQVEHDLRALEETRMLLTVHLGRTDEPTHADAKQ